MQRSTSLPDDTRGAAQSQSLAAQWDARRLDNLRRQYAELTIERERVFAQLHIVMVEIDDLWRRGAR